MTGLITKQKIFSLPERYFAAIFLILAIFLVFYFNLVNITVFASERLPEKETLVLGVSIDYDQTLKNEGTTPQPINTESRFVSRMVSKVTTLPFETVTKEDPEREYGEETVLQEGKDGKNTKLIKITYAKPDPNSDQFEEEEFEREVVSDETIPAKEKIVSKGIKIVWRTLDTPEGQISYWRKMRVYATHYDKYCLGCNDWTAIGMRAGKGVIAVDPKVIKMRSQVYVPGYGKAIAGDTGGAIKGNIIDLGYDDARTAGWSARYVDIYLLDKAPY